MENQITPEWIAEQRRVCEAASPVPWIAEPTADYAEIHSGDSMGIPCALVANDNNAQFIASSRTALPAALDALEAAYVEIARLTAERDAESEQIQEIGRFALEQQEATALCELFDAMWTVRAMCGSTIQCTENENAPEVEK